MTTIFHITTSEEADAAAQAGSYAPQAFAVGGLHPLLVSASDPRRGKPALRSGERTSRCFEIDRGRLSCDVLDENLEGGTDLFPHVYGRLPMAAVVRVHPFPCGADGRFELPESVERTS